MAGYPLSEYPLFGSRYPLNCSPEAEFGYEVACQVFASAASAAAGCVEAGSAVHFTGTAAEICALHTMALKYILGDHAGDKPFVQAYHHPFQGAAPGGVPLISLQSRGSWRLFPWFLEVLGGISLKYFKGIPPPLKRW